MVIKTVDIQVFADNDYVTRIELSQYEYLEKTIAFNIYHGKDKIDLSKVKEATFYGTKPDGHFLRNVCSITEDSQVIYSITEQTTACAGLVRGLVQLTTDEGILRCYGVNFIVMSAPEILPIESTDEVTGLNVFIEKIRELLRPNLVPEEGTEGYFLVKTENGSEWRSFNLTPEQLADIAESVKSELDLSEYAKKTEIQPAVDEYVSIHKEDLKGDPGNPGEKGDRGDDGFSPIVTTTQTETGAEINITDASGDKTVILNNGKDGEDYNLTEEDKQNIADLVDVDGVYVGTEPPVDPKITAWIDTDDETDIFYQLTDQDKQEIAEQASELIDIDSKLDKPAQEGTAGQVLGLNADGATEWINPPGGSGEKEWKKISNITLEEDVKSVKWELSETIKFKEMKIMVDGKVSTQNTQNVELWLFCNNLVNKNTSGYRSSIVGTLAKDFNTQAYLEIFFCSGYKWARWGSARNLGSTLVQYTTNAMFPDVNSESDGIYALAINTQNGATYIPAGTKIEIWGLRA